MKVKQYTGNYWYNKLLLLLFIPTLFESCGSEKTSTPKAGFSYSYTVNNGDTINVTNEKGRQGRWFVFSDGEHNTTAYTCCPNDSLHPHQAINMTEPLKVEEGIYRDNKREGKWIFYEKDGTVDTVIVYSGGLPEEK